MPSRPDGSVERSLLALDGVHFDLLSDVPTIRLTWRTGFRWANGISAVDVGPIDLVSPSKERAEAGQ